MSYPRQVLPGVTSLVTRRCSQRQFLLRPSAQTNAILLYCLARAAALYGVEVHAYCFLSNHYHLVVTDPRARLPEFMRYLNEHTARAINASPHTSAIDQLRPNFWRKRLDLHSALPCPAAQKTAILGQE